MTKVSRVSASYALLAIALLLIPVLTRGYILNFLTVTWILAFSTLGLYFVRTGGQINFAHAGFMAAAAYTSGLLTTKLGISFWMALVAAGILAGLLGVGLGWLTLRLKGAYFFLVSFAVAELILILIMGMQGVTGGSAGLSNIPPPSPAFKTSPVPFYYLALGFLMSCYALALIVRRSRTGLVLRGIAQAEALAESAGINTISYKVNNLALGSAIAGLSGSLFGHHLGFISPDSFALHQMIAILSYLIVGGLASPFGAVMGAVVVRTVGEAVGGLREYQILVSSGLLLGVLLFFPGGIVSLFGRISLKRARASVRKERDVA